MPATLYLYLLSAHQESRDANGAAIALFTARLHNPLSPKTATLQSLVHQLDAALNRLALELSHRGKHFTIMTYFLF